MSRLADACADLKQAPHSSKIRRKSGSRKIGICSLSASLRTEYTTECSALRDCTPSLRIQRPSIPSPFSSPSETFSHRTLHWLFVIPHLLPLHDLSAGRSALHGHYRPLASQPCRLGKGTPSLNTLEETSSGDACTLARAEDVEQCSCGRTPTQTGCRAAKGAREEAAAAAAVAAGGGGGANLFGERLVSCPPHPFTHSSQRQRCRAHKETRLADFGCRKVKVS